MIVHKPRKRILKRHGKIFTVGLAERAHIVRVHFIQNTFRAARADKLAVVVVNLFVQIRRNIRANALSIKIVMICVRRIVNIGFFVSALNVRDQRSAIVLLLFRDDFDDNARFFRAVELHVRVPFFKLLLEVIRPLRSHAAVVHADEKLRFLRFRRATDKPAAHRAYDQNGRQQQFSDSFHFILHLAFFYELL